MEFAAVSGANKPLVLGKASIPQPPARGLRIKTSYAGVCHTDINFIRDETDLGGGQKQYRSKILASRGEKYEGTVLGHEVSGIVEDLGSDVDLTKTPIRPGDRVLVYPWFGCQSCNDCLQGYNNLCETNQGGSMDLGLGRNSGGYSTHVVVPDVKFVVKVPESIGLDVACMIPCSGITAYWAVIKAQPFVQQSLDIRGGAKVLVNGAGGLGLWAIQLLHAIYKDTPGVQIHASDIGQEKIDLAREKGANHAVLLKPGGTAEENASLLTDQGAFSFNAVLDFVGRESTVNVAMQVLSKWGALAVVGMGGGQLAYPLLRLTYNTLTVFGTRTGPIQLLSQLVDLVGGQKFPAPAMQYFNLHEVNDALDLLRQGKVNGRALLKF